MGRAWLPVLAASLAWGCSGEQSALAPAGRDAERIAELFWWMAGGAVLVWVLVIGLAVHALRNPRAHPRREGELLILGGGVAFPTLALGVLLAVGLHALPQVLALPEEGGMRIAVGAEQWWWRVRYGEGAEAVELANELRLPLGERVEVVLESADVIHSFWAPALAGKVDAIPGRVTRLALEPTRTGTFRGACAEFCGDAHARMAFHVVVEERAGFEAWLERQRAPAAEPGGELARRGRELFLATGCGACHAVRGTEARGVVGPDLTHVGSRLGLAAATLPNEAAAFARWIARPEELKPGAHMPAFAMLPPEELEALAAYLEGLE